MKAIRKSLSTLATVTLMAAAGVAHAVPFSITSAALTSAEGYGIDRCEHCGVFLDVRFDTSVFANQLFSLNTQGASKTFRVGTVNFQEPDAQGGINSDEVDHLGVQGALGFASPVGMSPMTVKMLGMGKAFTGAVSDSAVDYILSWKPQLLSFGSGGLFQLSFSDLSFHQRGIQDQMATITLVKPEAIPEPGSMVLCGLGLVGLGLVRRRKAKK